MTTIQITPGVTPHWSGETYTVYDPPGQPRVWAYHESDPHGERIEIDTGAEVLVPESESGYRVEWVPARQE